MAWIAIQLTGIVNLSGSNISIYGAGTNGLVSSESVLLSGGVALNQYSYTTDKYHPLLLIGTISVVATIILFLLVRQRLKHPCKLNGNPGHQQKMCIRDSINTL